VALVRPADTVTVVVLPTASSPEPTSSGASATDGGPSPGSHRRPLAATNTNPFLAGTAAWTQDFSSGEAIRSNYDQTVTLSPCHLQYLYQGMDPSSNQSYNLLPWRIGLATQTNATC
jgi:endo-1,4-beta-xylanase